MVNHSNIRLYNTADAESLMRVYIPFVEETVVIVDYDVPGLQEWKGTTGKSLKKGRYTPLLLL